MRTLFGRHGTSPSEGHGRSVWSSTFRWRSEFLLQQAFGVRAWSLVFVVTTMVLTAFVAARPCRAGVPAYTRHVLRVPGIDDEDHTSYPQWVDLNGDGRSDALGILPDGRAYVAWQKQDGFAGIDQAWPLPAETAWITAAKLDEGPGLDIIVTTGQGWLRYQQQDGRFATEPVELLDLPQAYNQATVRRPSVSGYGFAPWSQGMPAVFADRVVFYKIVPGQPPEPSETVTLERESKLSDEIHWYIAPHHWSDANWELGNATAYTLFANTSFDKTGKRKDKDKEEKKDAPDRFRESLEKKDEHRHISVARRDINGDGKTDALIRVVKWGLDCRTTFYVFLARADGQFDEKPDQELKCRGTPASWDPVDVNGDGRLDLITVEPRNVSPSIGFAVDVFLSGKIDTRVAIRTFDGKGFSRRPVFEFDAQASVMGHRMGDVQAAGDFNGDGRKDLMMWRSPTQIDIFLSRTTGELFERRPDLRLDCPPYAWADVEDLNDDKIADMIFISDDSDELVIYLSKAPAREAGRK